MDKQRNSGRKAVRRTDKPARPGQRTGAAPTGKRIGKSKPATRDESRKEFGARRTERKAFGAPGAKPYGKSEPREFGKSDERSPRKPVARTTVKPEGKTFTKGEGKPFQKSERQFAGRPRRDQSPTSQPKSKTLSSEGMRLNRFIANSGVCSRREADTFISSGVVTINGKIVTELGTRVMPGDEVRFDGRKLNAEKKIYLLLNKPKDYVTTTDDPHAEKTVMDLVKNACEERIYPVGRLDRNTTGLLLFTNDGDLSKKLTHPSHKMKKVYQVSLDKPLVKADMERIAAGIELEDGLIAADAISYINAEEKTEIGIEIHSGRNRIVRRIFEHLGYRVKKLDRVLFAGLTKKNLPRGKWRFLDEKEIKFLKMV